MNILVTGSRGFLGTQLCKRLRADGHRVIGWDLAHSSEPDERRVDVSNWREVQCSDETYFHIIIHLAAEFGRLNGNDYCERMWSTATVGTRNVIERAKRDKAKLIFASSSEAYGDLADRFDTLSEDLLDTHAPNFHNEYALSKWCGEKQVRMHLSNYLILRLFNIYGPTEPKHQYRSFVSRITGEDGLNLPIYDGSRSHLHISDFLDAFCLLLDKTGVYNIGHPVAHSNEDVAYTAGIEWPKLSASEPNNVERKVPDVNKLMALGWSPKVSLEEGIRECLSASSCLTGTEVLSST